RSFQDTFIQSGEAFLSDAGALGLPFTVDPLVMYWNRQLFANAGIATPPRYWDEVAADAPKLTRSGQDGTLSVSTAALGAWENVEHAKEILLTLIFQLGNRVIVPDAKSGYVSVLATSQSAVPPAASALSYYADFANPAKPSYSWNASLPDSKDAFISNSL